jgi:hypothetical protein
MDIVSKENPVVGNKLYKMIDKVTVNLINNLSTESYSVSKSVAKLKILNDLKGTIEAIVSKAEKIKEDTTK